MIIFMLQRPDCLHRHSLPLLIDSLGPVITQHVIHPFLSLILSLCRDSIPIDALPFSTLFLSLPKLFSLPLFAFPYTAHTHTQKKLITTQLNLYGNSKPLILRERGRLKCFLPSNLKIAACQTKTHSLPCATEGSLISNVRKPNRPGNPFVITTALALAQSFGD